MIANKMIANKMIANKMIAKTVKRPRESLEPTRKASKGRKPMTPFTKAAAAATMMISALTSGAALAQTIVITNAEIYTASNGGDAPAKIENGTIVVRNGSISAMGADVAAPTGAVVIDAQGRIVTPGIIAPMSSIGLVEIGGDRESNDAGPRSGFSLGAALDARDAFNPSSTLIDVNRAGGVTRALAAPSPGDSLFGGQGAVINLSGLPGSLVKPQAAQIVAMGYSGAARTGDTRMGAWLTLRDTLDETRRYGQNPREYRRAADERFAYSDLEALLPVLNGEQPLFISANGANDLRNVIRLKTDYPTIRMVVVGGAEAWRVARALAAANIPVILDPFANLPGQFERLGATLENAARLNEAGVSIAFYNPPGFGALNLRALTQMAGNAVANGLPYEAAIAALTANPARMLGIDDRYGALGVGKGADLVIWDGDPLEVTARPVTVIIDGRVTSLQTRQTRLRERYKDLSRGDLPHAYRGEN